MSSIDKRHTPDRTSPRSDKTKPRANFWRFLIFLGPNRRAFIWSFIFGVIRYCIPLALPWVIKIIIDEYLPAGSVKTSADLNLLMTGLIGIYVIYAIASFYRAYFVGLLSNRVIFRIRRSLYFHLQNMSLSYFERRKVGSIVSRITQDISAAQNIIGTAMITALMDLVFIGVILVFLFMMNVKLALVSLAILPVYGLTHYRISGKIRTRSREAQEHSENIQGELHEQFSSIAHTQAFGQESLEAEQFTGSSRNFFLSLMSGVKLQSMALAVTSFLTAIGPVIVLWVGSGYVMTGAFTVGELVAFYSYLGFLYQPIQRMTELGVIAASSLSAIDRIYEVFDTMPEVVEDQQPVVMQRCAGRLRFEDVGFEYEKHRPILNNFSLDVREGESVALIGPSGAGKSTILKLLLRYYDPQRGSITLEGTNIKRLTLTSLRQQTAFVAQEPLLLDASIRDNLIYAKPDATDKDLRKAIKLSYCEEFIFNLPQGLDTMVGERGSKLSGGQKQRLAIARAFLRDAPIILLDEPTSALDPVSEDFIKEALKGLLGSRTAIIIAHRLSTIEGVDRIVVVENGFIAEEGHPEELLNKANSHYREMLNRQIHSASNRLQRTGSR